MTDYQSYERSLTNEYHDLLRGKVRGVTTGLSELDLLTGRMDAGQLWVIGGYTGTGKSAFILNLIEGMFREINEKENDIEYNKPKVIIYSTEMSSMAYMRRHVLLRAGLYKLQVENNPKNYLDIYTKTLKEYTDERIMNPQSLEIVGEITNLEQIFKHFEKIEEGDKPNVVIIDYVQELGYKNNYNLRDTMPVMGAKLKEFAFKHKVAVVCVSQVNNYAMKEDSSPETKQLIPFTFGKEMVNAAHVAILLKRDKKAAQLENILQVLILKAREGQVGIRLYQILPGYKLAYINDQSQ